MTALLEVQGLVKHFVAERSLFGRPLAHVRAVDGVSFSLEAGKTLALVGESGCGKSTVSRLVLRLIEPDAGSVRFDGRDLLSLDANALRAFRREAQIIFQDPYASLNPRMTVGQIPTLFFVSVLIFSLQQLLPGDPALVMAGEERDPAVIEQIRQQYKLDQPIPVQYVYWLKGVLTGNFGESLRNKMPVRELIAQKLPVTLQLGSMAIVIAFCIGIPAGIVSAVKKGTAWDYGANLFALWGISTPNFWLGILLIFLFSIKLGWLPASGYVPLTENWRASLAATIMPAFVLGNAISAILMRHTRSAMLQVLESDYVRTARAKGLSERSVILKHAMRNALTPIITLGALELGTLLSGAVLTEQIFSIPGFGKLIVDAVFNRDYAVVQGVVLVTATVYITLNLIADVAYVLVNPRLRG